MKRLWPLPTIAILVVAVSLNACLGTPGTTVTQAGSVVYLAGPKKDTVTVTVAAPPEDVFNSVIRTVMQAESVDVIERNDESRMVEVVFDGRSLNAQATEFGDEETLLFIWADARETGFTGNEVAISTIDMVSQDLNASYEIVEN